MLPETVPAATPVMMLDVQTVAAMLGCSTKHVYRLRDAGRMPSPLKLGSLLRWRAAEIEAWIAAGCQPIVQRATRQEVSR